MGAQVLSFGTTGNLRHSDLVMWDQQTESWWQQFTGEAIVGELTGTQLTFLAAPLISWADFKGSYPDGEALSRETGFERPYGANPYPGHDSAGRKPSLFDGLSDPRLSAMARVAAVAIGGDAVAYPFDLLAEVGVVNDTVGEQDLVVFWKAGTSSALNAAQFRNSRDVGSSGIFERVVDAQTLTFDPDGEFFRDRETGSKWTLLGEALQGPLAGQRLARLLHHEYFWFAWAPFRPYTRVYGQ